MSFEFDGFFKEKEEEIETNILQKERLIKQIKALVYDTNMDRIEKEKLLEEKRSLLRNLL